MEDQSETKGEAADPNFYDWGKLAFVAYSVVVVVEVEVVAVWVGLVATLFGYTGIVFPAAVFWSRVLLQLRTGQRSVAGSIQVISGWGGRHGTDTLGRSAGTGRSGFHY